MQNSLQRIHLYKIGFDCLWMPEIEWMQYTEMIMNRFAIVLAWFKLYYVLMEGAKWENPEME